MCRLYDVTRAGYYAWRRRGESARSREDRRLLEKIEAIYRAGRGFYGSPRVFEALKADGERIGEKRVARLMREQGIRARSAKLYRATPGTHAFFSGIPNRALERLADQVDRVWVGDITYLKVGQEWRYFAVVMDKYSRRIIGWSLSRRKNVALTLRALERAVFNRRPGRGVVFHTDRGIEYAGYAFRERLAKLGFVQSMNRPGKMTDNAHMESFFHSMKSDVIHGCTIEGEAQAVKVIRGYIPFYNHQRLHSSLGYVPPAKYESYSV